MFVGRKNEIEALNKVLSSDKQENVLIYGRRRTGKTMLIKEAIKDKNALYFEAIETNEITILNKLGEIVSEHFHLPLAFSSFFDLFKYLFEKGKSEDLIFVIDEYSYLRNSVPSIDSIIQSYIDEYKFSSRLKLVLCGSYVEIMKNLVDYSKPLYGRFSQIIELKPMDYYDSAEFYKNYSDEEKVAIYSVFGGIPFYNALINDSLSVKENIVNLLLAPYSPLYNEVENYLKSEINKITNANSVFEAIALKATKFTDIKDRSHIVHSPTLSLILNKLIEMDIIKKEAPINDPHNKKKAHYYIGDNLTLFYYKYVYRYKSQLVITSPEIFYKNYIEKDLYENHIPKIFEMIAKQFLIRKNIKGELETPFLAIGKYYYDDPLNKTNGEFDVVTKDEKGYIFYECKYTRAKVNDALIKKEIAQVKNTNLDPYKYGFFSRSGFDKDISPDIITYTLKDMYL